MNRTGKNRQSGIVIGPILFVVAILAVLASAIAAGSGAFNSDTSAVSAKAQATAILEYANEVKIAVDRVYNRGCLDTQISFENPIVSGYTNPNAPSDKSCHVFDVNGGGITYSFNQPEHICSFRVKGLGTETGAAGSELVLTISSLSNSVCMKINDMLGIQNPGGLPPQDTWDYTARFTGTYNNALNYIGDSVSDLVGKQTFCVNMGHGTGESGNAFMKILITR